MKLRFGPYTVETSNDDKVLFPRAGITKADVVDYYSFVAELMLPHLEDRCLTLQRFPDGLDGDGFYQQKRPEHFPDFVGSRRLPTADGNDYVEHILIGNQAGLVYLADQGTITLHGWLARTGAPRHPDRLVFDLDPPDGDFDTVVLAARELRDAFELAGLVPFVMTTGSRGLHVVAPLDASEDFDSIRELARELADATAARHPERLTVAQRKSARRGRVYLDIMRNAYGQTAVLPYSLRARPDAPVATPLDWDELGRRRLSPQRYHLRNLRRRLARKTDPFRDFFRHRRRPSLDGDALARWAEG